MNVAGRPFTVVGAARSGIAGTPHALGREQRHGCYRDESIDEGHGDDGWLRRSAQRPLRKLDDVGFAAGREGGSENE